MVDEAVTEIVVVVVVLVGGAVVVVGLGGDVPCVVLDEEDRADVDPGMDG